MKKLDNTKVSEDTPKLGLESGDQNATATAVVNPETAKAEQEAKAKAEQEAKDKAEQEAKAKAEQEAKAKAEQEAKAKAEQEAKDKAEQEAKAKAEQEAKDKAEQEAKAGAESNELVWIRVLLPLAGKFLMPHDPGAEFEIDKNQGEVIVEAAYAEYLTAEEIAAK
jgi:membrane protein involved in colicin uptake